MHIATVISASEYKAASLRWWNAAWSLAKELKLGKELPVTPSSESINGEAPRIFHLDHVSEMYSNGHNSFVDFTEEQREERRRIWWLLYTVDRYVHAACL